MHPLTDRRSPANRRICNVKGAFGATVAVLGVLATTCGSSSNGGNGSGGTGGGGGQESVTCSSLEPSACGGDVTGTWQLTAACGTTSQPLTGLPPECAGTVAALTPTASSGTAVFSAPNTYKVSITLGADATVTLSSTCLTALAGNSNHALACAAIAATTSAQVLSITCALQGSDCQCVGAGSQTINDSGTFSVSGNDVTLTSSTAGSAPETLPYCVRSQHLILQQPGATGPQPLTLVFGKS